MVQFPPTQDLRNRGRSFRACIRPRGPTRPAAARCCQRLLSFDSLFGACESFLGRAPAELTANFISEIGWSCQIKPLSKDKHQSDPGCHGRVITAPKLQAEHITSCRARWATASYLSFRITIWKVLAQQPPSQASRFFLLESPSAHDHVIGQAPRPETAQMESTAKSLVWKAKLGRSEHWTVSPTEARDLMK